MAHDPFLSHPIVKRMDLLKNILPKIKNYAAKYNVADDVEKDMIVRCCVAQLLKKWRRHLPKRQHI